MPKTPVLGSLTRLTADNNIQFYSAGTTDKPWLLVASGQHPALKLADHAEQSTAYAITGQGDSLKVFKLQGPFTKEATRHAGGPNRAYWLELCNRSQPIETHELPAAQRNAVVCSLLRRLETTPPEIAYLSPEIQVTADQPFLRIQRTDTKTRYYDYIPLDAFLDKSGQLRTLPVTIHWASGKQSQTTLDLTKHRGLKLPI